ncbi:MAG: hypothetical protein HFI82_06345 [Eubacterium sp.]|jgi:hypothetical protein|nr:hypothetical protein [Eubacterium sp.]
MEDAKIQWHPGFVAAMNLEFAENRGALEFEPEYNLNRRLVQELKGDGAMCQALMEIMEPEIRLKKKEWMEAGMQQGIRDAVDMFRTLGHEDNEIRLILMNKYNLSEKDCEKYFH